jgi:hypothetical protein
VFSLSGPATFVITSTSDKAFIIENEIPEKHENTEKLRTDFSRKWADGFGNGFQIRIPHEILSWNIYLWSDSYRKRALARTCDPPMRLISKNPRSLIRVVLRFRAWTGFSSVSVERAHTVFVQGFMINEFKDNKVEFLPTFHVMFRLIITNNKIRFQAFNQQKSNCLDFSFIPIPSYGICQRRRPVHALE